MLYLYKRQLYFLYFFIILYLLENAIIKSQENLINESNIKAKSKPKERKLIKNKTNDNEANKKKTNENKKKENNPIENSKENNPIENKKENNEIKSSDIIFINKKKSVASSELSDS